MKESIDKRISISNLLTDEELLILFEDIYNTYYKISFYIIYKYVPNYDDVCDLVNDCFLKIYKNIKKIKKNIKYYIAVISKNNALQFIKKQNNVVLDNEYVYKTQENNNHINAITSIQTFIKEFLSELEIEIIELHLLYKEKFKDISKQKGMKIETVKTIYYRAIKKVKEKSDLNEK